MQIMRIGWEKWRDVDDRKEETGKNELRGNNTLII